MPHPPNRDVFRRRTPLQHGQQRDVRLDFGYASSTSETNRVKLYLISLTGALGELFCKKHLRNVRFRFVISTNCGTVTLVVDKQVHPREGDMQDPPNNMPAAPLIGSRLPVSCLIQQLNSLQGLHCLTSQTARVASSRADASR